MHKVLLLPGDVPWESDCFEIRLSWKIISKMSGFSIQSLTGGRHLLAKLIAGKSWTCGQESGSWACSEMEESWIPTCSASLYGVADMPGHFRQSRTTCLTNRMVSKAWQVRTLGPEHAQKMEESWIPTCSASPNGLLTSQGIFWHSTRLRRVVFDRKLRSRPKSLMSRLNTIRIVLTVIRWPSRTDMI